MEITLERPDYENFIREKVDAGQYPSPAAVVEAALNHMMTEEMLQTFPPGELDRLIAEGEASIVAGRTNSIDEVFDELQERHRLARIRAGK